jgi:type III secretion protein U
MKEQTEQKALPASEKKLRDARRKGQVSQSRDLVASSSLLAAVAYLLFAWPSLRDRTLQLIEIVSAYADRPFVEMRDRSIELAVQILLLTSVPMVVLIVTATVTAGMVASLGLVLSAQPLKPEFDRINPAQGLKRIFSLRNLVGFSMSVGKIVALAAAFWFVLRAHIQSLFQAPVCGAGCLGQMVVGTLKPLAVTAALAFLIIGLIDVLVQRRLFLRDMRMTRTEHKRELKDLEGDPLIRQQRSRLRHEFALQSVRLGIRNADFAIAHGNQIVGLSKGISYVSGAIPVPIVVSKGQNEVGVRMIAEARRLGIPIVEDSAIVTALIKRHAIRDTIQRDLFRPIGEILLKLNLV